MENVGLPLTQAVYYVLSIITDFASMSFPGTNIPYLMIPLGAWGIYYIWKYVLGNMFDVEWRK